MDYYFNSQENIFTKKNLITLLILSIIIVAIPLGVKLIQTQQILKSKAAGQEKIEFVGLGVVGGRCSGNNCETKNLTVDIEITSPPWNSPAFSMSSSTSLPILTPTPAPVPTSSALDATLTNSIITNDRDGIKKWAQNLNIEKINLAVSNLSAQKKNQLADTVLNVEDIRDYNNKIPPLNNLRNYLLTAVIEILNNTNLGFYADILSYTTVRIGGDGFFATCNQVTLAPDFTTVGSIRDLLIHEAFHSFNCVNGGPGSQEGISSHANPLDEGSAIWITKVSFPQQRLGNEMKAAWAETTYGTKNYYRDIGLPGYPKDIPLEIPSNPTQKLLDVYSWLSQNDPSKLPWNNLSKLQACYDRYYKDINRNVDFGLWLSSVASASTLMAQDSSCRPD